MSHHSSEDIEIPDEFHTQSRLFQEGAQNKKKKLTMGLSSYKDIKAAMKKNNSQHKYPNYQECTFTPKVNRNGKPRKFKEFIEKQNSFLQRKNNKVQVMKSQLTEREERKVTDAPQIDSRSRRISEEHNSYDKQKAYKRLSSRKKPQQLPFSPTFTPKILAKSKSLKRTGNISTLLYSDAERRFQKQNMKSQQLSQSKNVQQVNSNKKTNQLVCQKIRGQFLQLLSGDSSTNISPIVAIAILSQLFNIELNPNKDEQLCIKVIQLLIEEEEDSSRHCEQIPIERLWDCIKAILGIVQPSQYFTYDQQNYIQKNLSFFYSQRLNKVHQKTEKQDEQKKIQLSQKTNRLAENYRNKQLAKLTDFILNSDISDEILNKDNDKVKFLRLQDMFLLNSIRKRAELEQKHIKKQKQVLKQCSFKPNIQRTNNYSSLPRRCLSSKKICENAQNIQHQSVEIKGAEVVAEEEYLLSQLIEQQKKPIIQNNKKQKKQTKKVILKSTKQNKEIKNVQKTILRLSIGRKMRNFENEHKVRGYQGKNEENWTKRKQSQKKQIIQHYQNLKGYKSNY